MPTKKTTKFAAKGKKGSVKGKVTTKAAPKRGKTPPRPIPPPAPMLPGGMGGAGMGGGGAPMHGRY